MQQHFFLMMAVTVFTASQARGQVVFEPLQPAHPQKTWPSIVADDSITLSSEPPPTESIAKCARRIVLPDSIAVVKHARVSAYGYSLRSYASLNYPLWRSISAAEIVDTLRLRVVGVSCGHDALYGFAIIGEHENGYYMVNDPFPFSYQLSSLADTIPTPTTLAIDKRSRVVPSYAKGTVDGKDSTLRIVPLAVLVDSLRSERTRQVQLRERQIAALSPVDRKLVREEKVRVGMPVLAARLSWGEPDSINRTITENGTLEQWVYGTGSYLYITDGVVSGIQN